MFVALTEENNKISIEDGVPGRTYLCPVCRKQVMVKAAKSDNVRTHFAHKKNTLCLDTWKHDMSEWHLDWQSKFPLECREVVVERDGEVHRADILINNTVIEFQHSPITSEEFEERNLFYKKSGYRVVWLFDASGRMKEDECFGLVWKRKITLFSKMKTPIDAFYVQNFLPEYNCQLLYIDGQDPKEVLYTKTLYPLMPDNFLKEYGGINDKETLSISDIIVKTTEFEAEEQKKKRELEEAQHRAEAQAIFNQILRRNMR